MPIVCNSQNINPDLLTKNWKAAWISVPETSENDYGVYYFRKNFELDKKPEKFIVHVSGDNRYKLFVNGKQVSIGPARGDLHHWNFETLDILPFLVQGKNTVSSIVWNDGEYRALAQITKRTGFILQGDGLIEEIINTNTSWKGIRAKGYQAIKPEVLGFFVAPPGEFLDMNNIPNGWMSNDFNDQGWKNSISNGIGNPKGVDAIGSTSRMLVQSQIPQMEYSKQRFQKLRTIVGGEAPSNFPEKTGNIQIPPNTKVEFLLDQTFLTNAYTVMEYSKGKNASVSFQYAESLYDNKTGEKNHRDEIQGKKIIGLKDSVVCNGLDNQNFTSLFWRTFRYINISIQTKDDPLLINDLYGIFSAYPFKNKTQFVTEDILLSRFLEIGWRTARLCAGETYMDTPLYEQLQYVGDSRIQAMISYYNSGDDRLSRQAINSLSQSRLAEGVTQGCYPSSGDNIISSFSLFWIGMLHDYYQYRPDADFVKTHLAGMRQILSFFDQYKNDDGTLNNSPYWNFIDWPESGRGWKKGVPPLNLNGGTASMDFLLLWAYQWASHLEDDLGNKGLALEYSEKASKLQNSIRNKYWDAEKGIFADNVQKKNYSQHANTLAILTETVSGNQAKTVFEKLSSDENMTKASIYFQYYINQALNKVGLGNHYLDRLEIWKDYERLGMTTWGEDSNIKSTRSDCHAWSASPNIEFFRIVLGIDSSVPGFSRVRISPNLGKIKKISGEIPHPRGSIKVNYVVDKNNSIKAVVDLPDEVSGIFQWNEKTEHLRPGRNNIKL